MRHETEAPAPGFIGQLLAFARSAEPARPVPRRALVTDGGIALAALAASLVLLNLAHYPQPGWQAALAAVLTTAPLALRRRSPLTAYLLLLAGMLAASELLVITGWVLALVVFAGYSAIAHSRFRGAALFALPAVWSLVLALLWVLHPRILPPVILPGAHAAAHVGLVVPVDYLKSAALLVLVALVAISAVGFAVHAADSRTRLQAEHEAELRRALDQERARIAAELHDVVTHNVAVMMVQAGAARQVLTDSPGDATHALLAVEASGRSAMAELRNLLGLLSPSPGKSAEPGAAGRPAPTDPGSIKLGDNFAPQPGLAQLDGMISRLRSAGLPVELHTAGRLDSLPPGVDLAAFRLVQEALTNVLKHAGKPETTVTMTHADGMLSIEVADAGPPVLAAAPAAAPGARRGLLGLRERVGLYGGELHAGATPGGGWLVAARIPVGPARVPRDAPDFMAEPR